MDDLILSLICAARARPRTRARERARARAALRNRRTMAQTADSDGGNGNEGETHPLWGSGGAAAAQPDEQENVPVAALLHLTLEGCYLVLVTAAVVALARSFAWDTRVRNRKSGNNTRSHSNENGVGD